MLLSIAKKIFGTRNDRIVRSFRHLIVTVNDLEKKFATLSDRELAQKTQNFRERISNGEPLDNLMAESFAAVREASKRTLGMRHFDVQLVGGAVLHKGMISEMKTGEGKTLVATLAAYLNALSGKGVHIVTVNDYLAKRDSEWMGRIYKYMGLSVGCVLPGMTEAEKKEAYNSDITYGQNNEFGFDYLRDNMKFTLVDQVQRGHHYAIVDEVDSILIDEARTPLIISGPAEDATDTYYVVNKIVPRLEKGKHFEIELKTKQPHLSEDGIARCEELLGIENLYDPKNIEILHHVQNALKAHFTMERDVEYVVKDGQIIIVDEFTGRLMPGRRWSNGLHQAIEAKENLKIAQENQTLATITFQNLFRMYSKLAGMTGTADTESAEFKQIYGLEVVVIPTNREMVRVDHTDQVFRTRKDKYEAVVEDIQKINAKGQPVLVGTISIDQSENLSKLLQSRGIAHNVLNAKQHEREAEIVAQAGRYASVTISTNMAGRGTDIVLGGNADFMAQAETGLKDRNDSVYQDALLRFKSECEAERQKVLDAGGLFIMGTERHEARRIDNQLRGRSGRQGDPGESRFYVSLEDDLMMRFGGERIQTIMKRLGWEEGMAIDGRLISRSIESAQRRVEGFHFDQRKHVTEYDDVMNKQRQVIYSMRSRILHNEAVRDEIREMVSDMIEEAVMAICDEQQKPVNWNLSALEERYKFIFNDSFKFAVDLQLERQNVFDHLRDRALQLYDRRAEELSTKLTALSDLQSKLSDLVIEDGGDFDFTEIERDTLLAALDHFWNIHLQDMDYLREGIGLRGYGQKNPLHEYQREGFVLFQQMLLTLQESVLRRLYYYEVPSPQELLAQIEAERKRREEFEKRMRLVHQSSLADKASEDPSGHQDKDPNSMRERLAAQRKARRKMK